MLGWKEIPSWYLLAENDRMISPHTQRFMAERINAHIHSLPVDHSPLASAPDSVVKLIVAAIDGTCKSPLLRIGGQPSIKSMRRSL